MKGPLLEARGIVKSFGTVRALRGTNFTVPEAEVVALIGDNGAGKSTLISVLSGALAPDSGDILVDGRTVRLASPKAAHALGIETVYQDLALCATLGAAANLFYGRELVRGGPLGWFGILDKPAMRERSAKALAGLGVALPDIDLPVGSLSGGQRQSISICRAATWARRVVFLDEPTAALGVVQTRRVLDLIRRVRDQGTAVVLVSHNMPQVLEVADRIEVLRLGARVARFHRRDATPEQLVAAMTGALVQEDERA